MSHPHRNDVTTDAIAIRQRIPPGRRAEVFPLLSCIQNIGYEQGEHCRSPAWYRANHRTPWVAGLNGPSKFEPQSPTNPLG